jgi:hypothetical protein
MLRSVQYGAEVNLDEDQGEASDMRISQSPDGPDKFHYLSNSIPNNTRLGVNRGCGTYPGPRVIGTGHNIAHRPVFVDICCIHILNTEQVLLYLQNKLRVYVI